MAESQQGWDRIEGREVIDFDSIEVGIGLSLGNGDPRDSYPTLTLLSRVNPDGGRLVEVVGVKEDPFSFAPVGASPEIVRQTIEPGSEVVIGRDPNEVGFALGNLASRTHLALQRGVGAKASILTVRDLNSTNGTFKKVPILADPPAWLKTAR